MNMVGAVIVSVIYAIAVMLVGFIIISQLTLNATANASGALTGSAATNWTTFVAMVWVGMGLLAFTPLILVLMVFVGLLGGLGGKKM